MYVEFSSDVGGSGTYAEILWLDHFLKNYKG